MSAFFDVFQKCLLVKTSKDPSDWKNWTSAQDFCVEAGGTLVTIENEVEQGRVLNVQSGKITIFIPIFI